MSVERRTMLQLLAASPLLAQLPKPDPLLSKLCDLIVPGAVAAAAPEFIELLAGENPDYRRQISGGLLWLDAHCADRYSSPFLACTPAQQTETLDLIAFRERGSPGAVFFALLRDLTLDAYFTSRAGIDYLGFRGNSALKTFPGCPAPS